MKLYLIFFISYLTLSFSIVHIETVAVINVTKNDDHLYIEVVLNERYGTLLINEKGENTDLRNKTLLLNEVIQSNLSVSINDIKNEFILESTSLQGNYYKFLYKVQNVPEKINRINMYCDLIVGLDNHAKVKANFNVQHINKAVTFKKDVKTKSINILK